MRTDYRSIIELYYQDKLNINIVLCVTWASITVTGIN